MKFAAALSIAANRTYQKFVGIESIRRHTSHASDRLFMTHKGDPDDVRRACQFAHGVVATIGNHEFRKSFIPAESNQAQSRSTVGGERGL